MLLCRCDVDSDDSPRRLDLRCRPARDRRRPRQVGLAPDARARSPRRAPSSIARRTATRRSTASTPASATSRRRASTARPRRAADEPGAQPRRRRRRAAAGARGARVDGAARQRAGQGLLRHSRRDARGAARAAQSRRPSPRAEPRLGRRQRRPGAARPHRAGAGRRRRRGTGRGSAVRRARRSRGRPHAGTLGPKEGLALVNGTQVSTAVLALALAAAERWPAPPTSSPRCPSTRCAARCSRSRRAFTPPGRSPDRRHRPTTCAGWSRAARSTRRTPTAAACRTPTRCAARRKCTARPAKRSPGSVTSSRSR